MIIGSISSDGHDPNMCIYNSNTNSLHHIEEERISRIKHGSINKKDIFYEKFNYDKQGIIVHYLYEKYKTKIEALNKVNLNLSDNISINDTYYLFHHTAHAAYTYYTRPLNMEDTDILSYDGWGSFTDKMFFHNEKLIDSNIFGLGMLWNTISYFFFSNINYAGKLMGLSAYGKLNLNLYEKFFAFIEKMLQLDNTNDYNFLNIKATKQKVVRDLFKNILNDTITKNNIHPEDICFTLQKFSEDYVLKYLKIMRQSNNLCLAGGSALNGYINNLIIKNKIYKNIHIGPATGDSGLSIGAVLFIANKFKNTRIHNAQYIGNSLVVNENIFKDLKIKNIQQVQYDKLYDIISDYIINGKIVGWMQGRSESGPRALGNRSILCDPRDPNMKDYLNRQVKHRENFRPFAPSIMEEYVEDWFENIQESKYMLKIAKYKEGMGERVPVVCHIDYTGRIQTVSEMDNKHIYNLIKAFYKKTGIPILLNTSFNDNEEPIVDSIEDAINTFNKTGIDILVLKNYIIEK